MSNNTTLIKRMSIKEFRDLGFLQEANRQFFHPLGLALEAVVRCKESPNVADSGEMLIGGIWDCRDDPEGILFKEVDVDKVNHIERLRKSKLQKRIKHNCDNRGIQQY